MPDPGAQQQKAGPAPRADVKDRGSDAQRIGRFLVENYVNPANPSAQTLARLYGPSVDYYHKPQTRDQVVSDKLRYYRRWPQRRYGMLADTLSVASMVATPNRFEYTFQVSAGTQRRAGRGIVRLVLEARDGGFLILSESGDVLQKY